MSNVNLSGRLKAIASFVEPGLVTADIGTDHGFLPIALVQDGTVPAAYACDVRTGPLAQARKNIAACGLTGKIETRLSDGFGKIAPGEAECAVIAGMGGPLTCRILSEGEAVVKCLRQLVLSPQSEPETVRRYLYSHGMHIAREMMLVDTGKFYVIFDARQGGGPMERACYYRYGRCLVQGKDPVLSEYLEKEYRSLSGIRENLAARRTEAALRRLREIDLILEENREAADEMR